MRKGRADDQKTSKGTLISLLLEDQESFEKVAPEKGDRRVGNNRKKEEGGKFEKKNLSGKSDLPRNFQKIERKIEKMTEGLSGEPFPKRVAVRNVAPRNCPCQVRIRRTTARAKGRSKRGLSQEESRGKEKISAVSTPRNRQGGGG